MYPHGSQPAHSPQQPGYSQQGHNVESFVDRLRRQEPAIENFRFADVSVYVDGDGSRYRIERLPASPPSTTVQPTPLHSVSDLGSSQERQPTEHRGHYVDQSNENRLFVPSPSTLRIPRYHQPLLQPETVRRRSVARREDSDTYSRSFREVPHPTPWDVRYGQIGDRADGRYIHDTNGNLETFQQPTWKGLENGVPSLELSPVHSESQTSFPRDHRLANTSTSTLLPSTIAGNTLSYATCSIPNYVSNGIDLRTPVALSRSTASTTSGESVPIETERPGERMLFETNVALAMSSMAEFVTSSIRVFINPDADNLRIYIESESFGQRKAQSFRIQRSNTELVPIYGYSASHTRIVCLKEKLQYRKKLTRAPTESMEAREDAGISIFCEFYTMEALFEFQKKLLDEEIFLDIERARYLKVCEGGNHTRQIDAPRIQIWHEVRSDNTACDDNMSHYTAGTMLSGPMKHLVAPTVSRLVIYLGRSEEFMTIFITDEITIEEKGQSRVVFSATKLGLFKNRTGIRCYHARRALTAAGIRLDKAGLSPDEQDRFDTYKSFEIDFECAQNRLSFVETWTKMLQARRRERIKLKTIQEEVSKSVYTGRTARKIVM
ncbi:hypothetical protein FB567DRAFT_599516 [Paraphoma chrysanthemicola]|uniref:Uncharacterized protein n=1 Tax=Paraphoma chrysanthemicola TaxID=798071 RepID=A0A8K0QRV5_9PLEO|nr:hypothetical protein FB567DRAFT_599516 [Paraphoma chrysanthemicola]